MASHEPHWVEELFPPAFGLTLGEIMDDDFVPRQRPEDGEAEEVEQKRKLPSVFQKVAHKISPLDVTAIKNVYERVWLMQYYEQKENIDSGDGSFTLTSSPKGGSLHLLPQQGTKRDANTSTSDIYEKINLDVEDSCIWTSQEIEVLRAVFKTANSQNIELKAKLAATSQELDILKRKYKVQNKIQDTKSGHLNEAKKANERLKILCDSLKAQNKEAERKIVQLDKEIHTLRGSTSDYVNKIQGLQKEADFERLKREQAETDLALQNQEVLRDQILREENLKTVHQEDIKYLQKKIQELQVELKTERKGHERTKKGLDHLRTHFASLPMSGEGASNNAVSHDQLKKWSYS